MKKMIKRIITISGVIIVVAILLRVIPATAGASPLIYAS